ncbi:MAG: hypothetical protein I3274_06905 [Candidatus Moeniiplasma glomeromycotorum]|nr:hypothetical protein [Candidatus Moeniiplasma glomeromycotorum]MCE8168254.1 hypothetical protein [Candidatus Moeniiplasma glomeromycotorum]
MIKQECEVKISCDKCKKEVGSEEYQKATKERGYKVLCEDCEKVWEKEEREFKEKQKRRELKNKNH